MIDWSKTAFMFPGQGSQALGMGADLVEEFPQAQQTFDEADAILGFKLSTLCFEGPESELDDTLNTQPAVFTQGIATVRALRAERPEAQPAMVAGHSFGEITALVTAGALSFEDGLKLARERGRLMKAAGQRAPGAMAAILGLDIPAVEALCAAAREETGGVLVVANDNCPGQVVISGDGETLDRALELAAATEARKTVKLAVSIAAHSPLMQSAADPYRDFLTTLTFRTPQVPVYGNLSAAPLETVDAAQKDLADQLTGAVRWTKSMQAMIAAGANTFIEFGAKDVLASLLKRIDRSVERLTLNNAEALQAFLDD